MSVAMLACLLESFFEFCIVCVVLVDCKAHRRRLASNTESGSEDQRDGSVDQVESRSEINC